MLSSEVKKYWIVPINVEAACISDLNAREDTVNWFGQTADLSRLPYRYTQGGREYLYKDAHISENLVTPPFQTTNAPLERGIHLHWALPSAMANAVHNSDIDTIVFPEVPNRWIIVRRVKVGGTENTSLSKAWMVESDHISTESQSGSTAFPVQSDDKPFRYIGRVYELSGTAPRGEAYLDSLTALGYGDPAYSVYYPDCRNVFGFSDDAQDLPDDAQVEYRVMGYFAQASRDLLSGAIQLATALDQDRVLKIDNLLEILATEYAWKNVSSNTAIPDATLCCGLITNISWNHNTDYSAQYKPQSSQLDAVVAIGNSTTDALAVLLANKTDTDAHDPKLEYLLNALQLGQLTDLDIADSLAKIEESIHQNGFGVETGGDQWVIRKKTEHNTIEEDSTSSANNLSGSLDFAAAFRNYQLPDNLIGELDALNQSQRDTENLDWEVETRRRQLFADWYKYIVTEYEEKGVEVNDMRFYIENRVIPELTAVISQRDQQKQLLTQAAQQLQQSIQAFNQTIRTELVAQNISMADDMGYVLEKSPASHFWHANEPVLLFCGDDIQPSKRYGNSDQFKDQDGMLACGTLTISLDDAIATDTIVNTLRQLIPSLDSLSTWELDRWNPHFLQWEVEFHPLQKLNNRHGWTGTFADDYLVENYTLDKNNIELTFSELLPEEPQIFQGISMLSDRPVISLKTQLEEFISRYDAVEEPTDAQNIEKNLLTQLVGSVDQLALLSQSISGFNAGLLMHKQTLQLSVKDPVTDNDFLRQFTNQIDQMVNGLIDTAPLPHNSFIPLRTGLLKLSKIYLVDTFGRYKFLDSPRPIVAESLLPPPNISIDQKIYLPPRIVQPSRLLFNFLDAIDDQQEMNTHPGSHPIFGWVMPNFLNNSLLIYDQNGDSVCTLMLNGAADGLLYEPAPGTNGPITFHNQHLSDFVGGLVDNGASFLKDLIRSVDVALTHIEPASSRQHNHTAVLMGQPMALVRASLQLEIKGPPAHNQSYESFESDMINNQSENRDTNGFTQVKFPVRLGDLAKINDGMVGYFLDTTPGATDYQRFYSFAAIAGPKNGPGVQQPGFDQIVLTAQKSATPQQLTMLIDPRAKIHATTGILPVKTIDIPPDQYQNALENIKATFLITPLLSTAGALQIPLPKESGYQWSWIEKIEDGWDVSNTIESPGTEAKSAYSPQQIKEGWLQLAKNNTD